MLLNKEAYVKIFENDKIQKEEKDNILSTKYSEEEQLEELASIIVDIYIELTYAEQNTIK